MTTLRQACWLLLGLLPGSWACARAPYQYQPSAPAASNTAAAAPQLLFLSFRMSAAAVGPARVELLKAVAVAGETTALPEEVTAPSYLLITQLDAAGQPCGPPLRAPHPLLQQMEYPAEGSTGRLERREVTLPEAEFFVRLARLPRAASVRVAEVRPTAATPASVTFPLPI